MKFPLFLVAMLCLTQTSFSQIRIGATADYVISTSSESTKELSNFDPFELIDMKYVSSESTVSYGLSLYNDLGLVWLRADFNYRKTTHNFITESKLFDFKRDGKTQNFTQSYSTIHIPVSSGVNLMNFIIGGGPILNYRLDNLSTQKDIESIVAKDKKLTSGFQFSIGYMLFDRFQINLKREYHFTDIGEDHSYNGVPVELKRSPHLASINLSVYL